MYYNGSLIFDNLSVICSFQLWLFCLLHVALLLHSFKQSELAGTCCLDLENEGTLLAGQERTRTNCIDTARQLIEQEHTEALAKIAARDLGEMLGIGGRVRLHTLDIEAHTILSELTQLHPHTCTIY